MPARRRTGPTTILTSWPSFVTSLPHKNLSLADIAKHLHGTGQSTLSEAEIKWSGEAPSILYGYSAGLIELEVNRDSGEVRLLNT